MLNFRAFLHLMEGLQNRIRFLLQPLNIEIFDHFTEPLLLFACKTVWYLGLSAIRGLVEPIAVSGP
jgi:hypothetical protein